MSERDPKRHNSTRRQRRAEGRRKQMSFDMQPALYFRMKRLVAVIRRDRGPAFGLSWYVQQCIDRCLRIDCEAWGIEEASAHVPEDASQ